MLLESVVLVISIVMVVAIAVFPLVMQELYKDDNKDN